MNFKEQELETIRVLKESFPKGTLAKYSVEEQTNMCVNALQKLVNIWKINFTCELLFHYEKSLFLNNVIGGGGLYIHAPMKHLVLLRPSIMTLIHEFKHVLQYQCEEYGCYKEDKEEDAVLWSHTIFKLAFPERYEKSKKYFYHTPVEEYELDVLKESEH